MPTNGKCTKAKALGIIRYSEVVHGRSHPVRYVADLFQRLQRAEWALATARRRASTWGFGLLVPEGRCDRSIQTHAAEVWAAEQMSCVTAAAIAPAAVAVAAPATTLPAIVTPRARAASAGGAGSTATAPLAAMSSSTLKASLSEVPGLGRGSTGNGDTSPAAGAVARVRPAFADHSGGLVQPVQSAVFGYSSSGKRRHPDQSQRSAAASPDGLVAVPEAMTVTNWRIVVAKRLLAGSTKHTTAAADAACHGGLSASPGSARLQLLSAPALLALVADILSSKPNSDAAAMCSGRPSSVPDLPAFVFMHFAKRAGDGVDAASRLQDSLVQLVASVRTHAQASKDVARFGKSMGCLGNLEDMVALGKAQTAAARGNSADAEPAADTHAAWPGSQQSSSGGSALLGGIRGPKRVRFDALPASVLLPELATRVVEQLTGWPSMSALLAWVASGAFLGHVSGQELGRPLLDVQVGAAGQVQRHALRDAFGFWVSTNTLLAVWWCGSLEGYSMCSTQY